MGVGVYTGGEKGFRVLFFGVGVGVGDFDVLGLEVSGGVFCGVAVAVVDYVIKSGSGRLARFAS